jgi:hypothetical protein
VVHVVTDGAEEMGWVHTHGMAKFNMPELEIRKLPLFMALAAVCLLNTITDYMLNSGKQVVLGQSLCFSRMCIVGFEKLQPIGGSENHFETERWALVDPPEVHGMCSRCSCHHEGTN